MANKRQRKKQKTKQNIQLLQKAGKPKQFIKQHKNNDKQVKKIADYERKKAQYRHRSQLIRDLGLKPSEHANKRGWGQDRWDKWYKNELKKKKRREDYRKRKERNKKDLYLLIFWRDKTADGYADSDVIERYKYQYKYMDNDALLENINRFLREVKPQGAEIGTTSSVIVRGDQVDHYINFYTNMSQVSNDWRDTNDWVLVHKSKATRYHDLLLSVHAVIRLLYDSSERASFMTDLVFNKLPLINKNMAKRLAKDLGGFKKIEYMD